MTYSKKFLEETIRVWQPRSREKLTHEDAREMIENAAKLVKLLARLDKKYPET